MRKPTSFVSVLASVLLFCQHGIARAGEVIQLNATQFYDGLMSGAFDAVVDTRTPAEWNETGQIENATLVDSLQKYNTYGEVTTPEVLAGCENCRIVVYCRSGRRAQIAAQMLLDIGFGGPIYNGQGVKQWTAAGYQLVDMSSVYPPCTCTECEQCPSGANASFAGDRDQLAGEEGASDEATGSNEGTSTDEEANSTDVVSLDDARMSAAGDASSIRCAAGSLLVSFVVTTTMFLP